MISVAIGLACAVVIDWLLADEDADAVRLGLSAIIGIGAATVTFGLAQGAGMALALVSSILLLVALGNKDAILSLGPLAGLVQFRLLSQMQPSSSHALDLGQHYALLCFTIGAVLPLLPLDWLKRQGVKAATGSVLWAVLLFGVVPLAFVMFGAKGVVGLVVGTGFSGVCQALRRKDELLPVSLVGGFSAASILSLEWGGSLSGLDRNQKIVLFERCSIALLAISIVITLLSFNPKFQSPDTPTPAPAKS